MTDTYENWTNDQIRQALVSLGEASYGPVTNFTRNSYLKKLRELQLIKRREGPQVPGSAPIINKHEATDENQAIMSDAQVGRFNNAKALNSHFVTSQSVENSKRLIKQEPKLIGSSPQQVQIKSEYEPSNHNAYVASRPGLEFNAKLPPLLLSTLTSMASIAGNTRKRKQVSNNSDKQNSDSERLAALAVMDRAPVVNSSSHSVAVAPATMRPAPKSSVNPMNFARLPSGAANANAINHARLDSGYEHASLNKHFTSNNVNVLPAASRYTVPAADCWPRAAAADTDSQLDDCIDENQAYRTHICESVFFGVRWLFILALCGAIASVLLLVVSRNGDEPHLRIENRSTASAASSNGAYRFRYCETYHIESAKCVIQPPVAQQLMQVAEQIVVDAAAHSLCRCNFERDDCPVRMEYNDFVSELNQRFGSVVNRTAQYLIVLLAESHANSALHFLNDSGVRLQVVQLDGDNRYITVDLQMVRFVEPSETVESVLPFTCRLRRLGLLMLFALQRLFAVICFSALVLVLTYFGWLFYEGAARRRAAEQDRLYALTECVFTYLRENCDADADQWIPVPYVRDALIAPRERSRSAIKCWHRVVTLLKLEESRVRFALRSVDGEEFECMKLARTAQERERSEKNWHGRVPQMDLKFRRIMRQESDEFSSPGLNVRLPAEYRCLKIMQMFDPLLEQGDDWHLKVQDAIIEKCTLLRKGFVNHVFVDKQSQQGIVYMKLSNSEAAREARELLHGSWFGSRLLIVKYVSIRRYLDRFVDARDSDSCRLLPNTSTF